METTVRITRETVFAGVMRRMEWEGIRNPIQDGNAMLKTATESDRSLFHSLFDEAAMHAMDICRQFMKSASNTDESLTLELELSKYAKADDLKMTIENMMTTHVIAQWQELVNPERSAASMQKRDAAASKIQAILYHHPKPIRR